MSWSDNPLDTPQQRAHELEALRLHKLPELAAERERLGRYWQEQIKPSPAMQSCFDAAFEEVMFGAVIWALNQDPKQPKVITISRLPHSVQGQAVPGSRWGIDNPDSVYRVIPVNVEERYVIRGQVAPRRMIENYFTLWNRDMGTEAVLSGNDLVVDADGHFEISVNRDASGLANHIQLGPDAHEFYIRDVIADWAQDRANRLSVERLGGQSQPPATEQETLEQVKAYMQRWVDNTIRWNNQAMLKPANEFSFTIDRDSDGALRSQIYIMGRFELPHPEAALVLTVNLGSARYFIAPITNVWGTSNEIRTRQSCLNKAQSVANPDGTYTFVVSQSDPGFVNWLDPCDMPEGLLTLRWAEFADPAQRQNVKVTCEMTTLDALAGSGLPEELFIPAQIRHEQLAARAESYDWRLKENAL